jgi:hypothetical protein
MRGPRPRARLLALAAALAAPVLYALWIRPRLLTWGATPDETTGPYASDELVPDPDGGATMATTLPAPPERVWAWLVQMGGGRGGWYSWDWLDNDGEPSADRIVPEWQRLEEGQQLKGPTNWWTVVMLAPSRTLVLQTAYQLPSGQGFDPRSGPPPRALHGRNLGLPPAAGPWRRDPSGSPYAQPGPPAIIHPAVRPAAGGTGAFHHADPPVPQPARPDRCAGVTWAGAAVDEFVRFERPTAWASVGRSRRLVANSNGQVSTTPGGTRLVVRIELRPQGALRLLLPVLGPIMRRREEAISARSS